MEIKMKSKLSSISVGSYKFKSKDERDKWDKIAKSMGYVTKKSSIRAQNLHPEYIDDYEGQIETGFGNSMYDMFWAVIYKLEVV